MGRVASCGGQPGSARLGLGDGVWGAESAYPIFKKFVGYGLCGDVFERYDFLPAN